MQTNILWTGIEYYSLENCIIDPAGHAINIDSVIVGHYNHRIYRVAYSIRLDRSWTTSRCDVKAQMDDKTEIISLSSNGLGDWTLNGKPYEVLKGCIDVDIPLTPLTNSIPINRIQFNASEEKEIRVVYIDLLEHRIEPKTQKYRRLSPDIYKYENVPNDFEAEIKVDGEGFVIDYPQLFFRTLKRTSHYQ